ncbi:ISAs1 family transposase [Chengkuizengella sp. SCS-71B]|uniref:ISAs1 family transposase n=1 Tax=Chengkuizengella sp. SCS-71B TaxID=3115290 RepID=UPI0032C248B5
MEDPRSGNRKEHKLIDILTIAVTATICGANKWTEMEEFGCAKQDWFSSFLELPNGIPSHDTFGRVFSMICSNTFEKCFMLWVQEVIEKIEGVVAIDGKSVRRSHGKTQGKRAIHLVSAWATENGMALVQQKVDEKSNEITAIPKILDSLVL